MEGQVEDRQRPERLSTILYMPALVATRYNRQLGQT